MYIENQNLSGLGFSIKKAIKRATAPLKKTVSVAKKIAAPQIAITRKVASKATAIHKASPLTKASLKVASKATAIHKASPLTKFTAKAGRKVLPIVAMTGGWWGAAAGALVALDKVNTAKRAKKLQERQNATTQAEIDSIDAEIRAIEAAGKVPLTANAAVGAQTASTNAAQPIAPAVAYGAGSENIAYSGGGGSAAESAPAQEDKPATAPADKKIPWGLIATGLVTALTMFK